MTLIENIVEPLELILTWSDAGRNRYAVARISASDNKYELTYLVDAPDYQRALVSGFKGHPSFDIGTQTHSTNVSDVFLRRIPPRKRLDFKEYLQTQLFINPNAELSDFALLGYSTAALPSDSFSFVHTFNEAEDSFQFALKVAGVDHHLGLNNLSKISVGSPVEFRPDNQNEHDSNAIGVWSTNVHIGFVNRCFAPYMKTIMNKFSLRSQIIKINGTSSKPRVIALVEATPNSAKIEQ